MWTPEEDAKLAATVLRARDVCEIVAAFPGRTYDSIQKRWKRLGNPGLAVSISMNGRKAEAKEDEEIARFVAVAKKGATLEEVCDKLDASPRKVKALLATAQEKGYRIDITGHHVGFVPAQPLKAEKQLVSRPGDERVFAVMSDLHVGSVYCLEDCIVDFAKRAYDEDGVRTTLLGGDLLDGCYKHSRWEESHHGFEAQATRLAHVLPRLKGHRYVGIIGNHDETFEKESGLSVVHALVDVFRREGRDDLDLVGARGAYLRLGGDSDRGKRGVLIELWHPLGGGAYALSYKMQRHIEGYAVGQKPDFLFTGHWHQQCYFVARGVHAFSAGTFHGGGSSFGKALGGAQAIGGWVVRYRQTDEGTVRDVSPTWRQYFETEQVRELGLG